MTVIENPIADEYFAAPAIARRDDTVVFVGSLAYPPNTDAITWIVQDIWPRVCRQRPDARLVVVGRGDGDSVTVPRMRSLVESVGGTFAVDVPDVRPYYWEASVVVAPLRLGAGLRNKVIHAMACHAPVVATPRRARGDRGRGRRACTGGVVRRRPRRRDRADDGRTGGVERDAQPQPPRSWRAIERRSSASASSSGGRPHCQTRRDSERRPVAISSRTGVCGGRRRPRSSAAVLPRARSAEGRGHHRRLTLDCRSPLGQEGFRPAARSARARMHRR